MNMTACVIAPRVSMSLLGLLAASCSLTVFELVPEGALQPCDQRLVGTWRTGEWVTKGARLDAAGVDDMYFLVTQDCRVLNWYTKEPPDELDGFGRLSVVSSGGKDFAVLPLQPAEYDIEPADAWFKGSALFRYEITGNRVTVYGVDAERVAALIDAKKIPGRSQVVEGEDEDEDEDEDKDMPRELRNLITGSPSDIATLLSHGPQLFHAKPMGVLERYRGTPPPLEDEGEEARDNDGEPGKGDSGSSP